MTEEIKTVETKVETAVVPPAEATVNASEVDYGAIIAEKDAELAKVTADKENYRRGLLKAKGKLPDDQQEDAEGQETNEEMMRRVAQEVMLSTKEAQLQAEKDLALKALLKQNKELKTALKNRTGVTDTSAQGSNERIEVKTDKILSTNLISALKAKGWSDKKIEDFKLNLDKVNQIMPIKS